MPDDSGRRTPLIDNLEQFHEKAEKAMGPFTDNDFEQHYANILDIFKELGYPQDLIGQWTLPLRDARTLMGIIQSCRPQNILEVGTFVGVTTLLMALMSSPETHIHSIDPNFPLRVEMESMKSNLYDFDISIKTQELALRAAQKLGIDRKITFYEGGFSTGNTFASYNTFPLKRIPVVGPEVCKKHGPFDFIFIDGLHYEEDVFSDINLAVEYLLPNGSIAIHDVLGRWGSNVRRGVFRFLEKHEDFYFSHDKFTKLLDSIGLIRRCAEDAKDYYQQGDEDVRNGSMFQKKLLSNLAVILVNIFAPSSVVQVGGDIALLEMIKDLGVTKTCGYVLSHQAIKDSSFPVKVFNPNSKNHAEEKFDLCLCLEIFDVLSPESIDNMIQACVDMSDTVIFAASPPGEMGNYQQNNKPIAYWISKFFEKGYLFLDVIRPVMEPHVEAMSAQSQQYSSYLMNLYLVRKEQILEADKIEKAILEEVSINKERRIEDLQLQNLYQRCIIEQERKESKLIYNKWQEVVSINRSLNEWIEGVNIFNKKVLQNSIKRTKEIIQNIMNLIQ